jgi:hypothetical protein
LPPALHENIGDSTEELVLVTARAVAGNEC